jgi:hypothetical protein
LYVDGVATYTGGPTDSRQFAPWVYNANSAVPSSVSIENLTPGRHTFQVSATDHAGNEGPLSSAAVFYSDPDAPSIDVQAPTVGGRFIPVYSVVTELGGVISVDYYVNGTYAGRATAAPYSYTIDMARFGTGTKSVTAVVTDLMGRTASSTKSVGVYNTTVPTISRMSDGPDPFYPILHDHYRDTARVSFRLAERAYVVLQVFDSSGAMVREVSGGWRRAGANSITWNGKRRDGAIVVGSYTYRLVANDGSYNVYTTGTGVTKIRSYYLKRLSRSRVRVVFS